METAREPAPIPAQAGIGLRARHYQEVLATQPPVPWFEVHSENYFGAGGAPLHYLEQVRSHYPLSLHGVGLSLGSTDELNDRHLQRLRELIRRFEPGLVSEHLCWCSVGGRYLNDLVPLPYTEEALAHIAARIRRVQDFLGREILVENVSSYLQYRHSTIPEWDFLAAVAEAADCGILLDVNNIYVSASNHGFEAGQYLRTIPPRRVREMHLAGFSVNHYEDGDILIDSHSAPVAGAVWLLYRQALKLIGARPTLIEWDTDIPALAVLLEEMQRADRALQEETRAVPA